MATHTKTNPAKSKRRLGRGLSGLINGPSDSATAVVPSGKHSPTTTLHPANNAEIGEYIQTEKPENPTVLAQETQVGSPMEIRIDQIAANPHQPRQDFNEDELKELAESIKQQGILQPLIVTKVREDMNLQEPFVLIAGERRLRAAALAGYSEVPCILREATDQQMIEWAVIENIQRSDLNPIERAQAYQDCMNRFKLNQQQVAQRMGQPRATIANYLRILDLCEETQEFIATGQLSFGHAKVLARLADTDNAARQIELARRILGDGMSVRKLEELIAAKPKVHTAPASKHQPEKQAYVRDIEQQLTEIVGTRVTVLPSRKKNHGKIVVEYYSLDDFDRIANSLGLDVED